MKLINLKRDKKKETKGAEAVVSTSSGEEDYPYGLRIRLGGDDLAKLGIKLSGIAAGSKVNGAMIGKVVEINESLSEIREERSLVIQITDIALDVAAPQKKAFDAFSKIQNGGPE